MHSQALRPPALSLRAGAAAVRPWIASSAGLLTAVQRQPAVLFQLDEFGMFLSAAADRKRSPRYVCEILGLLTELYTTAGTTYFGTEYASNQNNNAHRAIHQPCACVYGTTTPVHFWQALQAANVADGSLARFLILTTEEDFPDSNAVFGVIEPPQALHRPAALDPPGRRQARREPGRRGGGRRGGGRAAGGDHDGAGEGRLSAAGPGPVERTTSVARHRGGFDSGASRGKRDQARADPGGLPRPRRSSH